MILDNVATHGIGEPGIVGRYVDCQIGFIDDFRIIDVRVLLNGEDNNDNNLSEYILNIVRVTSYLEIGEKVVICSCAGVSRSNAIALGVLVRYFKMDFYMAMDLVTSKVPICNILHFHITALKKMLKVN
ncbi:MAG TPA: hypothetical protein VFI73_01465 [Candidatus Nitrosopolaris sp.]|nr:hypothetical protein [Candidatus Nitrosopolaris sp.]